MLDFEINSDRWFYPDVDVIWCNSKSTAKLYKVYYMNVCVWYVFVCDLIEYNRP